MDTSEDVGELARQVTEALRQKDFTIATAESCTGGLIAGALTSIPGSSDVVYGGFVTYANEAKIAMLGVPYAILHQHGAVSRHTALAMAEGAMHAAGTHVAVAVTGIAGPDGGSAEKPVGLVHFAVATADDVRHAVKTFDPGWSRTRIREAAVVEALRLLLEML